jgi:hypothetical protein
MLIRRFGRRAFAPLLLASACAAVVVSGCGPGGFRAPGEPGAPEETPSETAPPPVLIELPVSPTSPPPRRNMSEETLESRKELGTFSLGALAAPLEEATEIRVFYQGRISSYTEGEELARWTALLQNASIDGAVKATHAPGTLPPPGFVATMRVYHGDEWLVITLATYAPAQVQYYDGRGALVVVSGAASQGYLDLCDAAEAAA